MYTINIQKYRQNGEKHSFGPKHFGPKIDWTILFELTGVDCQTDPTTVLTVALMLHLFIVAVCRRHLYVMYCG